jgi:hypothetical protein
LRYAYDYALLLNAEARFCMVDNSLLSLHRSVAHARGDR